jgi:hypothetical protein
MPSRARIAMTAGLSAVVLLFVAVAWLDGDDWRKLLLFAGIVCVAAWGRGREVPSEHTAPEAAVTDVVPVGEEHPAP